MSKHLRAGKATADVKVSFKLSTIKPLHAKWIVNLYNTLKDDKEMTTNGFKSAEIIKILRMPKI